MLAVYKIHDKRRRNTKAAAFELKINKLNCVLIVFCLIIQLTIVFYMRLLNNMAYRTIGEINTQMISFRNLQQNISHALIQIDRICNSQMFESICNHFNKTKII